MANITCQSPTASGDSSVLVTIPSAGHSWPFKYART